MSGGGGPALPQTLTLDHVSPATRLLEKRRQMFEVQEALDAQKEEFARREEAFRRREEGLRKKDLDLQESLIRFNKFLQENESKRTRAEKRANDERNSREEKEQEVQRLLKKLEKEKAETKKKKEELAKNKKYQEYLERVQEAHSDDYPEISNILDRFKTLKDADESLDARQRETEHKMETQRQQASTFKKLKTNDILSSNNLIAKLKKQLEHCEGAVAQHQRIIDKARLGLREQTKELGQVLFSVENLYNRCNNARHHEGRAQIIQHGKREESDNARPEHGDPSMAAKTAAWIEAGGKKTVDELDSIEAYINDFREIVAAAKLNPKEAYPQADSKAAGAAGSTLYAGAGGAGAGATMGGRGNQGQRHGPGSPSASGLGSSSARDSSVM